EQRIPGYNQRLKVKSGITGLAQVMGKYNTDPEDKLRFDMIYIKNYSMLLDFKIILMSLGAFIPKSRYSQEKTSSDYVVTGEPRTDSQNGQKLAKKENPDIS
ncbi:MAG: sugar transferase, partial [Bacillota bacterium]|nr:sugar transferase [Bacillota bacterium]